MSAAGEIKSVDIGRAEAGIEHDLVGPAASRRDRIRARASVDGVVAGSANKGILAGATAQGIVAGAAIDIVGAVSTGDRVITANSQQHVGDAVADDGLSRASPDPIRLRPTRLASVFDVRPAGGTRG